jgi:hypothetical protein
VEQKVLGNSDTQLSWTLENLSPLIDVRDVFLDTFGAKSKLVLHFLSDLLHELGGFYHISGLNKIDFGFEVGDQLLTAVVASFNLS